MTNITIPSSGLSATFDLATTSYYLLLALGPVDSNNHIGPHTQRVPSEDKVNLGTYGAVSTASRIMIILHAGQWKTIIT